MKRNPALVRLSWDHHHGLVMARRIELELAAGGDAAVAALYEDLIVFWVRGLLPHFRVENECLLARLLRHTGPSDPTVLRTNEEHLLMEELVLAMREATEVATRREALVAFGRRLKEHIRWEEAELFERTQTELTASELDRLGEEIALAIPDVAAAPAARLAP